MIIKRYIVLFTAALIAWSAGHVCAQQDMPMAYFQGKKLYEEKKYEDATHYFYNALAELNTLPYKDSATIENEKDILNKLSLCYTDARKYDVPFKQIEFDTTVTEEHYFKSAAEMTATPTLSDFSDCRLFSKTCTLFFAPSHA